MNAGDAVDVADRPHCFDQNRLGLGFLMIRAGDLAAAIASRTVEDYRGEAVLLAGEMSVSLATTSGPQDERLTLILGGSPSVVWQFDPNALKQALVGKEKGAFQQIVESFAPAIQRADASIRPFWTSTFPTNPDKIKVIIKEEEK